MAITVWPRCRGLFPGGIHCGTIALRIVSGAFHGMEIGVACIERRVDIRHGCAVAERGGISVGSVCIMASETEIVLQVDYIGFQRFAGGIARERLRDTDYTVVVDIAQIRCGVAMVGISVFLMMAGHAVVSGNGRANMPVGQSKIRDDGPM